MESCHEKTRSEVFPPDWSRPQDLEIRRTNFQSLAAGSARDRPVQVIRLFGSSLSNLQRMEGSQNFEKMARHLANSFKIPRTKSTSPVRTLIDVTFPALDAKQKSRWSRALEFAASTKAKPEQLPKLFKTHSGIAGCARWAAKQKTKKKKHRDDWALDPCPLNIVVQKKPIW